MMVLAEYVSPDRFPVFLATALVLNLTPGADVMFAMASGLRGGPRAGMAAGLGVGLGSLIHCTLAVFGVSSLIAAVPAAAVVDVVDVLEDVVWVSPPVAVHAVRTPANARAATEVPSRNRLFMSVSFDAGGLCGGQQPMPAVAR